MGSSMMPYTEIRINKLCMAHNSYYNTFYRQKQPFVNVILNRPILYKLILKTIENIS